MKYAIYLIGLVAVSVCTLTSCGQSGPLYLPNSPEAKIDQNDR